jgi:hypothetical protein
LQRVTPEIRESYDPRRAVICGAPELESERSMLKLSSSSNLSAALELERFRVVVWRRAVEHEK